MHHGTGWPRAGQGASDGGKCVPKGPEALGYVTGVACGPVGARKGGQTGRAQTSLFPSPSTELWLAEPKKPNLILEAVEP